MITIHKYEIIIRNELTIAMPAGARILSVQVQHDMPQVWAMVDSTAPHRRRQFSIRGTGHPADGVTPALFIGTVQMAAGSLVFHVFDRGEEVDIP